jgi:hypothetical protein
MSLAKNSARAGLGLQVSYTFSKSIDDTSSVINSSIAGAGVVLQTPPQDPWNPSAEKGASTFDVTHVFTLSWIQLLPLDRVRFLRPLGRTLTSGWQFLNITTLMSGSPFTVYSGVQQTGAGAGGTDRPDLVNPPHFHQPRRAQRRLDAATAMPRSSTFRSIFPTAPAQTTALRHARPQHFPRSELPQLRRRSDQRHVRPPRQQRISVPSNSAPSSSTSLTS